MIHVEQLNKAFAVPGGGVRPILSGVDIVINKGEIFGIVGPSGTGKSTLLRMFNLLERPDDGKIHIFGNEFTSLTSNEVRQARQKIGMIFQQDRLLANKTVHKNVSLALEIAGWQKHYIRDRVSDCLATVKLSEYADYYPGQLSGGQRQRVGIARALANHPELILADEPTASLDQETAQEIIECIATINRDLGVTVVFVSHQLDLIHQICHRVFRLIGGKLQEVRKWPTC